MIRDRYGNELKVGQKIVVPVAMCVTDNFGNTDGTVSEIRELVMPAKANMPAHKSLKFTVEMTVNIGVDGPAVIPGIVAIKHPEDDKKPVAAPEEEKSPLEV